MLNATALAEQHSWRDNPTNTEIHSAYLSPQAPEHWRRIQKFVLKGGFGVEPNPDETSQNGTPLPEFKVTWPNPELKKQDYKIFFAACEMIIKTLHLDDEIFADSIVPNIFSKLSTSRLFTELYSKESQSQGNTVQHHVETVPTLVKTNSNDLKERFILRTTAVFHDIGKAFNIGRDQVHYHALISSNIVSWFMDEYKHEFVNHLTVFDKTSQSKIISNSTFAKKSRRYERCKAISTNKQGKKLENREQLEEEFASIRGQVTETIRLHHVLEQVDKKVLDLDTVAEIFKTSGITPATYGLFAIADGSSVIPDNEIYSKFLINNINHYFKLLDMLAYKGYIKSDEEVDKLKGMYAQTTLAVIRKVIVESQESDEDVQTLLGKVQAIIKELSEVKEITDILDSALARALLSLEIDQDVVI